MTGTKSSKKLIVGGIAAAAVAFGVVGLVLPAEFGVDPLGTGKAFGLTKLAEAADPQMSVEMQRGAKRTGVLTLSDTALPRTEWDDEWQVTLAPYEGIELKYTLDEGGAFEFAWEAPAEVEYDLHSHPFEGGTEMTEGYSLGAGTGQQGRYVAAFSGLHGWYWQNRTLSDVTVTIRAAGDIKASTVFQSGGQTERELTPPS